MGTLTLHPWTSYDASSKRSADDTSFLLVDDGDGDRIAVVDLKPGESATVVELVEPADRRARRQRVRRSMEITRGDKVVTLSEGDALQRVCLEY